jgi:hypothetical protein
MRERLRQDPWRTAAFATWRVADLEGFLGYFVARESLSPFLAASLPDSTLNTDDRNGVEFGFARTVGRQGLFSLGELRDLARVRGEDRLDVPAGAVDWARVEDDRVALYPRPGEAPFLESRFTPEQRALARAFTLRRAGELRGALAAFQSLGREPRNPVELEIAALGRAEAGDEGALPLIARWRESMPTEADAMLARLRVRQGRLDEAVPPLVAALVAHRTDPWPAAGTIALALDLLVEIATRAPAHIPALSGAIVEPFVTRADEEERVSAMADLVNRTERAQSCPALLRAMGPHFPWSESWLRLRAECYGALRDPRLAAAQADLARYRADARTSFAESVGTTLP